MREILFRGKTEKGEWVEGSLSFEYFEKHGCVMISPNEDDCFKVDPETVGQYIGLTDKNGKKIFEGDIVTVYVDYGVDTAKNENGIGVVRWHNELSRYYIEGKKGTHYAIMWVVETIGNIYNNPELLEGKK